MFLLTVAFCQGFRGCDNLTGKKRLEQETTHPSGLKPQGPFPTCLQFLMCFFKSRLFQSKRVAKAQTNRKRRGSAYINARFIQKTSWKRPSWLRLSRVWSPFPESWCWWCIISTPFFWLGFKALWNNKPSNLAISLCWSLMFNLWSFLFSCFISSSSKHPVQSRCSSVAERAFLFWDWNINEQQTFRRGYATCPLYTVHHCKFDTP